MFNENSIYSHEGYQVKFIKKFNIAKGIVYRFSFLGSGKQFDVYPDQKLPEFYK